MSEASGTKSAAHPARGRPARLSRELIVSTAPRCDLTTLTMRELATRLGASHSALYRWVRDREGLFDPISEVMVERILPPDDPTEHTWRSWPARLSWAMHDEFLAVPGYTARVAHPRVVQWLGGADQGVSMDGAPPRFDLFLDTLLRGLPARLPVEHPRPDV
ncbi:TetR/AcrR family transcriptional regulator [Streptomyces sp. MK37H]|uniref:TetR/AcrR family transcriptional regulator n=1 Tax=Streptomyces sp. MK37H TaxID=2699117 RepID=UPI001B35D244|nr:TetR/AcrR family transcriptional regulator [Streptomyces sp. MK37H]MBP8531729.1 TetR family transcriptional regulator [Streptomyces sp. MK37H]